MFGYACRDGVTRYVIKEHLDKFHRQQVKGKTGRDIVEEAGLKCVIAKHSRFYWRTGVVTLSPMVANGTDALSLGVVWHEIAHSRQPKWWFWFLWLRPVRWYVEWRAWMDVFGDV